VEDQSVPMHIAYPTCSSMRDRFHQGFDLVQSRDESAIGFTQAIFDPSRSPADKVGGKESELFLDLHTKRRTNEMTFQGEDTQSKLPPCSNLLWDW